MPIRYDRLVHAHIDHQDFAQALELAMDVPTPARGRVLRILARACGLPCLDTWCTLAASDPDRAVELLAYRPGDLRTEVRARTAFAYLADHTDADQDALFAAAAPVCMCPELEGMIQTGRISPEAVLNVASFDHAVDRARWLAWAARAAYARGEHPVALALIRAAARLDALETQTATQRLTAA